MNTELNNSAAKVEAYITEMLRAAPFEGTYLCATGLQAWFIAVRTDPELQGRWPEMAPAIELETDFFGRVDSVETASRIGRKIGAALHKVASGALPTIDTPTDFAGLITASLSDEESWLSEYSVKQAKMFEGVPQDVMGDFVTASLAYVKYDVKPVEVAE